MYRTACILTSQVPNFVADIHHKDLVTYAATPPDQPNRCNLIYCFNIVTLASSNSALPDDGDYADTCWSWFNVNFNKAFKNAFASVGVKNLIILRWTVRLWGKEIGTNFVTYYHLLVGKKIAKIGTLEKVLFIYK